MLSDSTTGTPSRCCMHPSFKNCAISPPPPPPILCCVCPASWFGTAFFLLFALWIYCP